jgi:hypothetical protein
MNLKPSMGTIVALFVGLDISALIAAVCYKGYAGLMMFFITNFVVGVALLLWVVWSIYVVDKATTIKGR